MFQKLRKTKPRQLTTIAVSLVVLALLTAAVGTRAWLSSRRTLQTITKVRFSTLDLIGREEGTLPINLGEINIKEAGLEEIEFGILSKPGTEYALQLGHTTNLPLAYEIYRLTDQADNPRKLIKGAYLNQDNESKLANNTYHPATYGDYNFVQKNAEPLYWKSNSGECVCGEDGLDKYILKISWGASPNITDKETEMIYLTAGLGGYFINETPETP